MANSNSNLGILSCVLVFIFCLQLSCVVLSNADTVAPSNDVASSICPKTRNVSLCWSMLKSAGTTDALKLANYTLNLAHTSAVECLGYAQRLEAAETENQQRRERYAKCSLELNHAIVRGIEQGKNALATGGYIVLTHTTLSAESYADTCLNTFKQLPSEPSELSEKAKHLGDICNVAVWVSTILAGDDYVNE